MCSKVVSWLELGCALYSYSWKRSECKDGQLRFLNGLTAGGSGRSDGRPPAAGSGQLLGLLPLLGELVALDVDGMDLGPRDGARVHAILLGDGAPVPPLGGELDAVPGGHGLQVLAVVVHPIAHALGVVGAHGDGNDADGLVEGDASALGLGGSGSLGSCADRVVLRVLERLLHLGER